MRQKIKGARWNTTATTAEQSTIFSKGIKIMTFCSAFYLSSIIIYVQLLRLVDLLGAPSP